MKRLIIKVWLLVALFILTLNAKNLGHKLGGDVYEPENTIYSYTKALSKLQKKKDFLYVEFDIRETKDNKIIVFHDSKIERLVPPSKHNLSVLKHILKKKKFNKIRIKDLDIKVISKLTLKYNATIPTLEDVLKASIKGKLKKPMHIEIKSLYSDKARYRLIEMVSKYQKKLDISFIAFSKNFYNSFPFPDRWIKNFQKNGLKFYQIGRYEFTGTTVFPFNSTTLLPETTFAIIKKDRRSKNFLFFLPKKVNVNNIIKIGIYHGSDDSGDKGVNFRVENDKGKLIASGFSNSKGWEWFEFSHIDSKKMTLVIDDYDTQLYGKYAGNKGKVKVLLLTQ